MIRPPLVSRRSRVRFPRPSFLDLGALSAIALALVVIGTHPSPASGQLYVTNLRSASVTAVPLSESGISQTWDAESSPHELAFVDDTLFVSNYRANTITAIGIADGTRRSWPTAHRPHGLAADGNGDIWFTTADGFIARLGAQTQRIFVGPTPHALVIDPLTATAYVAVAGSGELVRVDLRRGEVTGRVDVGATAESVALSADGSLVAVAARDARRVALISTGDLAMRWSAPLPDGPVRVAFAGDQILASLALTGSLAFLDRATGDVETIIPVGTLPDGIAVDSEHLLAYVAVGGDDVVTVVDIERREVMGHRPAGDAPSGLLLVNR